MRIDVLTLFPEALAGFLRASIVGRAIESGLVAVRCVDIRAFAQNRHQKVDDRPFGGGPGMVMQCGPVFDAVEWVERDAGSPPLRIMLTPQGELLTQSRVQQLAQAAHLLLLCGRYEGFDERIRLGLDVDEISIGDYVLSGGEPAAMVLIDAVVRLLPGALGHADSAQNDSFCGGLLEYPQYTRPREFRGMSVPEILLSGDHARIAAWRLAQAKARTRRRRPDMLKGGRDAPAEDDGG